MSSDWTLCTRIGFALQEERMRRNLTQRELAALSGVGVKTISSYECGRRIAAISVAHLDMLCSAMRLPVSAIIRAAEVEL